MKKFGIFFSIFAVLIFILVSSNFFYAPQNRESIRVMAGAGLTEVFTEIKKEFEKQYPKINIELNFAGGQKLAHQIQHGVYADIFASADTKYMNILKSEDLIENPKTFAHNTLIVGVSSSANNNEKIKKLNDLAKKGLRISIADIAVPIGSYTNNMLEKVEKSGNYMPGFKEKFLENVISKELTVRGVTMKIALGEADAGIIYKTEITPENRGKVIPLEISREYNVIAEFPIAVLKNSTKKICAKQFIDFVISNEGRKILNKYGFILPND